MVINELILKNFGRFCNRSIELKEGLNIIYGENESGKSTIHTFIRSMFFGIRKMRGRAAKTDNYTRYLPWENSGWYEGVMRFSCGGKNFRLERNFRAGETAARLICESDGELFSVEDGDLDMLLGGISEAVYDNTVSIGQMKSRTEEALTIELQNYLSNYQGAGDGRLDLAVARKNLKDKKKKWEERRKKRKAEEAAAEEQLLLEIRYLQRDLQELQERWQEQREQGKEPEERPRVVATGNRSGIWLIGVLAAGILLGIFIHPVAGILVALLGLASLLFLKSSVRPASPAEKEPEETSIKFIKTQIREKRIRLGNLQEELKEMQEQMTGRGKEEEEIRSIELAEQTIGELVSAMQDGADDTLKHRISQLLSQITAGRYRQVSIDENLQIDLFTQDRHIPLFMASTGTVEQVYLALRIAAGDLLCQEEPMPLLFDETFAMYDDKRLIETLKCLAWEKEQILLFTCNKREINALEEEGVPYHLIRL